MSDEDCICAKCHEDYSLRENCEPSKYCNACVHDVVVELEAFVQWCQAFAENTREAGSLRAKLRDLSPSTTWLQEQGATVTR